MAETMLSGLGVNTAQVSSIGNGVLKGALIFLIFAIVALIFYFFWNKAQYKHGYRLFVDSKDGYFLIDDTARVVKKKGQITMWKLYNSKLKVVVPPKEAISITKNGRLSVTARQTPNGDIKYIFPQIMKPIVKDKEGKVIHDGGYDEFTSDDKAFMTMGFSESLKYIPKDWTQLIMQAAAILIWRELLLFELLM